MKKGVFVPKSERDVRVTAVRASHFSMGNQSPEQARAVYETTNKYFTKFQMSRENSLDHMDPSPGKANQQLSNKKPDFNTKPNISLKFNKNNFDPNVHKGAPDTHGSVSTFKRFHTDNQAFGTRETDLEEHLQERKRIQEIKNYSKQSHIHMSTEKNVD